MDKISKEKRSRNMAAIKAKNTQPELLLRSYLHRQGYRYSLHNKSLPGKPDIFMRKHSVVIFVHGCFWHQHLGCEDAGIPKSNKRFWLLKLKSNVERDKKNIKELKKMGYKVFVVWECEINRKFKNSLEKRIRSFLK
jgi:DNA mismatch endonuclease (patch repair protein)